VTDPPPVALTETVGGPAPFAPSTTIAPPPVPLVETDRAVVWRIVAMPLPVDVGDETLDAPAVGRRLGEGFLGTGWL